MSDDIKLKMELWDRLRFRDKNYFHNRAYKMKKWDGYINFFVHETGKFLTGLLPEVSAVLKHFNVDYKVEDLRVKTEFSYDKIDKLFLNFDKLLVPVPPNPMGTIPLIFSALTPLLKLLIYEYGTDCNCVTPIVTN